MKLFLLSLLSLSMANVSVAQQKANFHTIDSLKYIYSTDKPNENQALERNTPILPPPVLDGSIDVRNDYLCEKKYNIPDSVFLKLYPFDADSILVVYADSCCDSFEKYNFLRIMTEQDITILADILYNYSFIKEFSVTIITHYIDEIKRPDIIFYFFHGKECNYLKLYFEESQVRFEDSFDDIYWGEECEDKNTKLRDFFRTRYDYCIQDCLSKCYQLEIFSKFVNEKAK